MGRIPSPRARPELLHPDGGRFPSCWPECHPLIATNAPRPRQTGPGPGILHVLPKPPRQPPPSQAAFPRAQIVLCVF